MSNAMKLGNTGFSIELTQNEDDINPCQVGKSRIEYKTVDHTPVKVEVYYPMVGRGPSFTWEWADTPERSHTVEEAGDMEDCLFSIYDEGVYMRGVEEGGGLILAAGKSLAYLSGTFMNGDEVKSTEFYLDGSFAYGYRAGELPVFTVDSIDTLKECGLYVLNSNCVIEHNGVHYLVTHNEYSGHRIEATSRRKVNEAFYRALIKMGDKCHMRSLNVLSPVKYATDFKGVNDEDIIVYECEHVFARLSRDTYRGPTRTFAYNGCWYMYISGLEFDESAIEALRCI